MHFNTELILHTSVLGVPHGAGKEEVRKAFLALARKHHPDVNTSPGAGAGPSAAGPASAAAGAADDAARAKVRAQKRA